MSYESLTRDVHAILSFYNEKSELVDISRAVTTITVKQITCSEDKLKMGEFCKNCLEFEYYQEFVDEYIAWNNKRVKLSLTEGRTEAEQEENKVNVGIFYVNAKDVETSNNGLSYKVTGYDLPEVLSEEFDSSKTTTKVSDIVSYICNLGGVTFKSETTFSLDSISDEIEEGISNIGMLAYIAGYDGKNIRMNGDGELETYWYYSNSDSSHFKGTISRSSQLLNEFTNAPVVSPLSAITSGYTIGSSDESSTVISVGSGIALTYINPYVTKEKLEAILADVKGFDYSVGSVKFRGNPNFRCGDTVQVETSEGEYVLFPIMEQTISYDGGMNATVTSYSYETENTVMGGMSNTDKKIKQAYNGLTAEFQRQTGIINSNLKGGYYRLLQDSNTKYPYGWMITDSEEITDTTKGWRWTQGGLQYSEDGFKTAGKIAITMDGAISADMITTGTLKAINIEGTTIKGSTISGNTISGGTISGTTINFGSPTVMTLKEDGTTGALFDGTGWFKVKAVGGFDISNFADTDKKLYRNRLYTITTDTEQSVVLYNYKIGQENKMANWCWATSNSNRSRIGLQNYSNDADDTGVDNWIYLTGDVATGERSVVIGNAKNSVSANTVILRRYDQGVSRYNELRIENRDYSTNSNGNRLLFWSSSGENSVKIYNYNRASSNKANEFLMYENNTGQSIDLNNYASGVVRNKIYAWVVNSSAQVGLKQYTSANVLQGNINITNNEAQIGSGDSCYLHFNTDGYIYAKTGNKGAYKVSWITVNNKLVLGVE